MPENMIASWWDGSWRSEITERGGGEVVTVAVLMAHRKRSSSWRPTSDLQNLTLFCVGRQHWSGRGEPR
jgi:hypothetical protein